MGNSSTTDTRLSGQTNNFSSRKIGHTPGRWIVKVSDDGRCRNALDIVSEDSKYRTVCTIINDEGPTNARDRANARLIASAPQLLEFSQQVIEAFFEEYEHEDHPPNNPTLASIRRLKATIKQARGGQ